MKANWQDVTGGAALAVFGLAAAWMAADLEIGSASSMGPGYFPLMAAGTIVVTGLVIAAVGFASAPARLPRPDWGPMGRVLLAGGAFAVLIPTFGLLPAVAATIILPAFFEWRLRPVATFVLTTVFLVASWLIFVVALGLPISAWRLPSWT